MSANLMLQRLRQGEILLGLCNMYPAPGIIEGMCSGWDFVWIDAQHGQLGYDAALNAVRAAAAMGLETLLRVPGHEPGILGPFADMAPSAVMVPMVNSGMQAGDIVEALRFAPLGNRSYGGRRVIDLYGREYYRERELAVVLQIETIEAVDNASEIINTEGVDALFFGPDDMKVQMGLPINTAIDEHPMLRDAMARTARAAREAGKFAGCVAATPSSARMAADQGYQLIIGGGDIAFMRTLASQRLPELRSAVQKPTPGTTITGQVASAKPKPGQGSGSAY